jgi:Raf kinase inhibitor-like YbhB/YbcL family protein
MMERGLVLSSEVFGDGERIPAVHTCHGANTSPPLTWDGAPAGTQSFALIMDDPDIPLPWLRLMTWTHWLVFNIPAEVRELPMDLPGDAVLDNGTRQAVTSFRVTGYGGPCPPVGSHRYHFRLYALDCTLDLDPQMTQRAELEATMAGHVLAEAELVGAYR